jgi:hypothetical protein
MLSGIAVIVDGPSPLPLMEKFGVASTAEVEIETLRDWLENEGVSHNGVIVSPSSIGAWV